jgi:putative tricarboxylic transport membrane protein
MTSLARDRLVGTVLLVVAIVWIALVLRTFPPALVDAPTSPRTFPLASGIGLAVLSVIVLLGTFTSTKDGVAPGMAASIDALERRGIAATFGFIVAYIVALKYVGFVVGTLVVLAAFLYFVLGKRSPWLLIGYPTGFAFGVWFILGKLMAVYLPRGELINLF